MYLLYIHTQTTQGIKKMTTETKQTLQEYIEFKLAQFVRLTGFDTNQDNAKEILKDQTKPLLKEWVQEAVAAGI